MPVVPLFLPGAGGGPTPPPPDVGHRVVSARLLDYNGGLIGDGSELARSFGIQFYDEWNGPGHGSISMPLSDANSALLLPGRYVDCLVDGASRFTFKIEGNPQYTIIDTGEEFAQVVSVAGRGWACVADEAITYPEFALKFVLETTWRLFSFASPSFPNTAGWDPAHEIHEYLEGNTQPDWDCYQHVQRAPDGLVYPAPIGFPWPTSPWNLEEGVKTANYEDVFWIRPGTMPEWWSTGYYFFRTTITISGTTPVTFTVTGDNFFTLFVEGVPILGEEISHTEHLMWRGWKEHVVWFPSGTFEIAAVVYNISWLDIGDGTPSVSPPCPPEGWAGGPSWDNPGGLLMAAYIDNGADAEPVFILGSDSSWDSYYDPTTWPGWTPGQILQKLIDEATARGAMAVYTTNTFTAPEDTAGEDWRPIVTDTDRPDIPTFAVEVGSTLLHALDELNSQGWINWHVQPGVWILDVWRGRLPAVPVPVATLAAGVNLTAFERNATAPYANALMIQWEGGYVVIEDSAAITAYGTRVEDIYSSDAATEEEAIAQGQNELYRRSQSAFPAIVATVEPTGATDVPYEGFTLGDYVTVPAQGGGTEDVRCLSIQCTQDGEGWASWNLELNAKLDVPERRTSQLLQQIGGKNQVVKGTVTS